MASIHPKEKFPKPGRDEHPQQYPGVEANMQTRPEFGEISYKGSGRLTGKNALVTGGDSGIGRAVAVALAKEGADVAIGYLPEEEEDARRTRAIIEATGRTCSLFPGDLRNSSYRDSLIPRVSEIFGGSLDILVNNAAIQRYFKDIQDIRAADFEEIYLVNVVAAFVLSQQAVKVMKPGASIINTVSIQAYDPSSILLPYASSKGAFVALTKGLAEQLLDKGIRVNAVAPGPIWSPLNTHGSPVEKMKQFGEQSAFGRPGQPVELSPVYVLLASDEASYITGEIYGVTGGEGIA